MTRFDRNERGGYFGLGKKIGDCHAVFICGRTYSIPADSCLHLSAKFSRCMLKDSGSSKRIPSLTAPLYWTVKNIGCFISNQFFALGWMMVCGDAVLLVALFVGRDKHVPAGYRNFSEFLLPPLYCWGVGSLVIVFTVFHRRNASVT